MSVDDAGGYRSFQYCMWLYHIFQYCWIGGPCTGAIFDFSPSGGGLRQGLEPGDFGLFHRAPGLLSKLAAQHERGADLLEWHPDRPAGSLFDETDLDHCCHVVVYSAKVSLKLTR